MNSRYYSIAVVGEGSLVSEISLCLLQAGHQVTEYALQIAGHDTPTLVEMEHGPLEASRMNARLFSICNLEDLASKGLVILVTPESLEKKQDLLRRIEGCISPEIPILVNTESFSLDEIREGRSCPERILGMNWVRPAHTTLFAELIVFPETSSELVDELVDLMKGSWKKDPYVVYQGKSIRARMMAAMIREAFFLIENGYVTEEDIDRACRNDAGYYLPFAGNLRYMDLMGTYVYGVVMEDLNKELSNSRDLPAFFLETLAKSSNPGLDAGEGFYSYATGEREKLEKEFLGFGKKIRELMDKYPFPKDKDKKELSPLKDSTAFTNKNRSN